MSRKIRKRGFSGAVSIAYEAMDGSEASMRYSERHGVESAAILTVYEDKHATQIARYLAPRIEGRTVVEIGAGVGLLALHLGDYAKRVFAIEVEPVWSWLFVEYLYERKPKHVSYLFGMAEEFAGLVHGDVALFCTHSGRAAMREAAVLFAPEVIDVHADILGEPHIRKVHEEAKAAALAAFPEKADEIEAFHARNYGGEAEI